MATKKSFSRTDRVSQRVLQILSAMILTEVRDPGVRDVQLTAAEVTPDIRHAKIFWVPLTDDADVEAIGASLERTAGFLRRGIAEQLNTKFAPELKFIYDESVERGRRIEDLLAGLDVPESEGEDE